MTGMTESNSVQAPIVQELVRLGWVHLPGDQLDRAPEQVLIEQDLAGALVRLNPVIAEDPSRVDEVIRSLRRAILAVADDGLVESNRDMARWLRGYVNHKFVGTTASVPVRLIDFENPANNRLVVSDEVMFGPPGKAARFDIVLWVNGVPLVVGECKAAVDAKVSWVKAAVEVAEHYEPGYPQFFVPGVFSFATEGKELMFAATGTPVQHWAPWGRTVDKPKLADVLASVRSLLAPRTVLDLLADFTLYEVPDSDDTTVSLRKLVARYTQYEAVNLMWERVHDGASKRGLIYHTQGSGKTLAMVFAAGKMLRDPAMKNPTIVLIADRVQLVNQMWDQFRTTAMPRLLIPGTATALQEMLGPKDQRGLVFSTVHKFAGAPVLNERSNIVVLVDEAHRTQEGNLGLAMREALPNATFFAFSGTPLAELDRNTFDTFGNPDDDARTLHTYDSDQSIADGNTVPIHVAPRKVGFDLDRDGLDAAFEAMVEEEDLDEAAARTLTDRASKAVAFFSNPERVRKVCADIVEHFYSTVDPLGMKAQVVVANRALCVAYEQELTRLLEERYRAGRGNAPDQAVVVMTVTSSKDEDKDWAGYALTDVQEQVLLKRFRTLADPLKFLIVTSKLGTGFNAPIEGVMYLDKPMKKHTLYQTITRTNRTWRNTATGQDKRYGLVVDYVGLGDGFARAMAPANPEQKRRDIDIDGLLDTFEHELMLVMSRFAGIDNVKVTAQTLLDAQQRLPKQADEDLFAAQYLTLEGIWETCAPHARLLAHKGEYTFLSKVYSSIMPSTGRDELIWHRLGAKTLDLVHEHMTGIEVTPNVDTFVIADADTIKKLADQGLLPGVDNPATVSPSEVLDTINARLKKRLDGVNGDHPAFKSLADRLERLREQTIASAEQSIVWLSDLFDVARDLAAAERAEDQDGWNGLDLLPDPNVGALTQIFREYAPNDAPIMVEKVVKKVDAIVKEVVAGNEGWAVTQKGDRAVRRALRNVLADHALDDIPDLFDRAYAYITEHY